MLERLISHLLQRRLASLLALLIVAPLVWALAPRIAIDGRPLVPPPNGRWWLIGALLLLWLAYWGGCWLRGRVRIRVEHPSATAEQQQQRQQETLRLEETERAFALVRRQLRRRAVRRLPHYLMLGDKGSGKSALLRAGPLAPAQTFAVDGSDWQLGEQAVVLETAPSLAPAVWLRLLRQLVRARRRRPLDGILLTLALPDLLQDTEAQLSARAATLRARLEDIANRIGHGVPVYLLLTQTDRLAGFSAFFAGLPAAEREQIWGIGFPLVDPLHAEQVLDLLPETFQQLTEPLHNRVAERLQALPDATERALALGFPLQFEGLYDRLENFARQLFHHSRYQNDTLLRGIYFTSARQQGQALHRFHGPLADMLDQVAPAVPPGEYGFFITGLCQRAILAEAGVVPIRRMGARVRRWLAGMALGAVLLATTAILHDWHAGYRAAASHLDQAAAMLRQSPPLTVGNPPEAALPRLDADRRIADNLLPAWHALLWRDAAVTLRQRAQARYRGDLAQTLAPVLLSRLTTQLGEGQTDFNQRYQALRIYLMLGDRRRLRTDEALDWIDGQLRTLTPDDMLRRRLLAHASDWLNRPALRADLPIDRALVARARAALQSQPLAPQLYGVLQPQLRRATPGQTPLSQLAGPGAALVLRRPSGLPLSQGIDNAYTVAGYRRYQQLRDRLLADPDALAWTLGVPLSASQLSAEKGALDSLYFADYNRHWDAMLADVALQPLSDLGLGGGTLKLLAGPDSPLRQLLQAASRQTTLFAGSSVDLHFAELHSWGDGGKGTAFAAVQSQLADTAVYMDAVKSARDHGMPSPAGDVLQKLQQTARARPGVLGNLLQGLVQNDSELARNSQRRLLDQQWQSQVASFCHAALDGRYPFARTATLEVTPDDFSRLFRPGGLIDGFFQKNLATLVDTTGPRWLARTVDPSDLKLSAATLAMFQRAAAIRDAFFADGGQTPAAGFDLTPLALDPALTRVTLTLDGQTLGYAHGPQLPQTLHWPGSGSERLAGIDAVPGEGGPIVESGPWALFRLLDHARIARLAADQYRLEFPLQGKNATFRLNAHSVNNPFDPDVLSGFSCRNTL